MMATTREWAASHGVCVDPLVPPVAGHDEPYQRTAEEVAIRTIILHCVAAVGFKVNSAPIIDWLNEQAIWNAVSPVERHLLLNDQASEQELTDACWRSEAQWALLWSIQKVEELGLPTQCCDTKILVDQIMPALGDSIKDFVSGSVLRSPAEWLGEDDRIYNLHCYARQAIQAGEAPADLIYPVLFQRHYAFEWLSSDTEWDATRADT